MPEYLSELLAELLPKLVDLASAAVNNPRLWAGAALAGFASLSLPFVRRMYGVNQREKTRRHIADHVASGRMSPESAVALLGEDARVGVAGEGFHAAAWTLGPVGAVILCAGIWLLVHAYGNNEVNLVPPGVRLALKRELIPYRLRSWGVS